METLVQEIVGESKANGTENRPSAASLSVEAPSDQPILAILAKLLEMANQYRREGAWSQAMDLYWILAEDHQGTPQSALARTALVEIATAYEQEGQRRRARFIYTRLLDQEQ
jgi:hypothetical protein